MTVQTYAVVMLALVHPAAVQGAGYDLLHSWTDGSSSGCPGLGCSTEEDGGTAGLAACKAKCDDFVPTGSNQDKCNVFNFVATGADASDYFGAKSEGNCCLKACASVSDLMLSSKFNGWDVYVNKTAPSPPTPPPNDMTVVYEYFDDPGNKCTDNPGYSLVTTMEECNAFASKRNHLNVVTWEENEKDNVCSAKYPCTESSDRTDLPPGCYGLRKRRLFFNRNYAKDRGAMYKEETEWDGFPGVFGYVCKISKWELDMYQPGPHDRTKCREDGKPDGNCCGYTHLTSCADGYVKGEISEEQLTGNKVEGKITQEQKMCITGVGMGMGPSGGEWYYSCRAPPKNVRKAIASSSSMLAPGLSAFVALLAVV